MKFIFETIKAKLLTDFTSLLPRDTHVDIWNNQLDKGQEGQFKQFPFPSVFIGFPESIEYIDQTQGVSQAEATIRLHIITKLAKQGDLSFFDFKDAIFFSINQLTAKDPVTTSNFTPLQRMAETYDEDRDVLYHFQQDYRTTWTDCSAQLDNKGITHQPSTLELNTIIVQSPDDC